MCQWANFRCCCCCSVLLCSVLFFQVVHSVWHAINLRLVVPFRWSPFRCRHRHIAKCTSFLNRILIGLIRKSAACRRMSIEIECEWCEFELFDACDTAFCFQCDNREYNLACAHSYVHQTPNVIKAKIGLSASLFMERLHHSNRPHCMMGTMTVQN